LKRGDVVTAAVPGDFDKPRPALVIQSFAELSPERITILLITGDLQRLPYLRIPVEPMPENGLQKSSEVAVDNIQTLAVLKIGKVIGEMDRITMELVEEALRRHLGLP
jgi:mRNA interferase MazF